MAATSIGNLAVLLTLSSEKFHEGMSSATEKLREFSGVGEIVGAVLGGVSVIALAELTKKGLENGEAMSKLSAKTGVATETLGGLSLMSRESGGNMEEVSMALGKVSLELGKAKDGSGEAIKAFERLGYTQDSIKKATTADVLMKTAEAMEAITDPTQKQALLFDLYGKKAAALYPILSKGKEAIGEATAEAEKLGISFSGIEAKEIENAMESFHKIGGVLEGVGNKLAVAIAPILEAVVNKFISWAEAGGGVGAKIGAALEFVASGVGTVVDSTNFAIGVFVLFQAGVQKAASLVLSAIDSLAQGVVDLANMIPGVDLKLTTFFKDTAKMYSDAADASFQAAGVRFNDALSGAGVAKVKATFKELQDGAAAAAKEALNKPAGAGGVVDPTSIDNMEKAKKMLQELTDKVANYGKTEAELTAQKIRGLTTDKAMIASADAMAKKLGELEEKKKHDKELDSEATNVLKELETPLDKYNAKMKELGELLATNRITKEQYDAASKKAGAASGSGGKEKNLEALTVGSGAAFKFLANRGKDDIQRKQLNAQHLTNAHLAALVSNTKKHGFAIPEAA